MNLYRKLFFVAMAATLLLTNKTQAQTATAVKTDSLEAKPARNIYAELWGPGLLFSLNYDTRFGNRRDGLGGRVGVGYISADGSSLFTAPVQLNYLLGDKGKYFEMGLGGTYLKYDDKNNREDFIFSFKDATTIIGTMTFGYRYQPVNGGFNFRGSINPIFNSHFFIPYFFGVSLGYTFK